ncbi:MAG: 6-carboxytetrahydropterin synthase QueD [Spirochaetaceae bacterium]|nr:6-carboxytetrahydropterin synthase QueD [Spirochaetaceae bacterium]
MFLTKVFKFDSAHNLVEYHGKCEALHGHTYRMEITIQGIPGKEGMILDYGILKSIVKERIVNRFDHKYLNDTVPQSTTENLVQWIWNELEEPLKGDNYELYQIKLNETDTNYVVYRGDEI